LPRKARREDGGSTGRQCGTSRHALIGVALRVETTGTLALRLNKASFCLTSIKIPPFIFLIREKATGSILFLGRLIDPTQ